MDRPAPPALSKTLLAWLLLAALPLAGCSSGALATVVYMIKGDNVPGDYTGLKGKRVVVVCRPTASLQYSNATASKQLARLVTRRIEKGIRRIEMIDPREVEQWTDENSWEEFEQVGRALKADVVLGIDLEQFSLYQGQTLYQGQAALTITVTDLAENQGVVYEKALPQVVFPPNTGIPASDRPEAEFRMEFLSRLSEQISDLFCTHDPKANFAVDALAL